MQIYLSIEIQYVAQYFNKNINNPIKKRVTTDFKTQRKKKCLKGEKH